MTLDREASIYPDVIGYRTENKWLPFLVGGCLCLLVAILWWTLNQREQANLNRRIKAEADYLVSHVDADLRGRIPSLQRIVRRWEFRGGIPEDEFISDAQAYFSDIPGFQAIEWVDKDFFARWVVPLKGNECDLNLNLAFEKKRRMALEKAMASRSPTMTAPIDLVQGGIGFLVYCPININGKFDGFILAVFRIQEWLDYIFNVKPGTQRSTDYEIEVSIDRNLVYRHSVADGISKAVFDIESDNRLMNHNFSIRISPAFSFIERNKTMLPSVAAGVGILLSILVAAVIYLFQKASQETLAARIAEDNMVAEQRNLLAIFHASPVGMLLIDEYRNIVMINDAALRISVVDSSAVLQHGLNKFINCIYGSRDSDRCGYATHCTLCTLRNAIDPVFTSGISLQNVELSMDILRDGEQKTIWLVLGAEPFNINDRRMVVVALYEITSSKETDEALKRSEDQVRLLLDSTGEAIFGIDMKGKCTFANKSCLQMLGFGSIEQILGEDMHSLIHHSYPDGRPMSEVECRIYKAFHMEKSEHVDDEVLWRADGSSFPVEYWSYPQIINGEVCGAVVTFFDITERKWAENIQKIRLELSDMLSANCTFENLVQTALDAAEKFTGSSIGFFNFLDEDEQGVTIRIWSTNTLEKMCTCEVRASHNIIENPGVWGECIYKRRAVIHNDYYSLSDRKVLPDGHPSVYRELTIPIIREDRIVAVIGVGNKQSDYDERDIETVMLLISSAIDVLLKKRTQDELKEKQRYLQAILDNTPAMIGYWDKDLRNRFGNRTYYEWFGITAEQITGMHVREFLGEERYNIYYPYIEGVLSGAPQLFERSITTLDGKIIRYALANYIPDIQDGEVKGFYALVMDITERKRAEEELERLNKTLQQRIDDAVAELRQKDQVLIHQGRLAAMGEMIGNIAHQWRQPINALSMLITNLQFAYNDGDLTESYMGESVATANRLIQKMSTTINDFRDFFSPDKETVDFSALNQIREAVSLVESSFKNKNIVISIDDSTDCILKGFPNEYSQVLLNLFSNAKEAIIETNSFPGLISVNIKRSSDTGIVTVCDNGGGIKDHLLEKIFEPYFTTKKKGTGIGLYMSKMIIERNMNGTISVSNFESGSKFSICIPLGEEK